MPTDERERLHPETIVLCVIVGIVLPMVVTGLAAQDNPLAPDWQSGKFQGYVALLGSRGSASPFYPFFVYAMICMGLVLGNLRRFGRLFVVRFGLLTGVVLALQYSAVMGIALWWDDPWFVAPVAISAAVGIPLGLFGLWVWARNRLGWRLAVLFAIPLALVPPILVVLVRPTPPGLDDIAIGLYIAVLGSAPFWALTAYLVVMLWTRKRVPAAPMRASLTALVAGTWLAGYAVAWWYAVVRMFEAYAALPTSRPGCYVATAAARGHPKFVKSQPVVLDDGTVLHVNAQMRTLKGAELVLRAASPRVHRACRRVYDTLGPALALRLRHPFLADAAYLTLKPVEWLAWAVLRLLIPGRGDLVAHLYRR
ncbi:MAG TPA: DUF6688 family protein [Planctomycetota bacterium]|nr:DUF6688 family protein [Planctomycetota bacterium]